LHDDAINAFDQNARDIDLVTRFNDQLLSFWRAVAPRPIKKIKPLLHQPGLFQQRHKEKSPQSLRKLRANPIQEELEETKT
jgi:hypothetical protein